MNLQQNDESAENKRALQYSFHFRSVKRSSSNEPCPLGNKCGKANASIDLSVNNELNLFFSAGATTHGSLSNTRKSLKSHG